MFRQLPKDSTLDELWRAGLVYSRPTSRTLRDGDEWKLDKPIYGAIAPTVDPSRWEYAILVEE